MKATFKVPQHAQQSVEVFNNCKLHELLSYSWEKNILYCEKALEKLYNLHLSNFLNSSFEYLKGRQNVLSFSIFENDKKN